MIIKHYFGFLKFVAMPFLCKVFPSYSFGIRSICICPTLRCNLRCIMCAAWGTSGICINKKDIISEDLDIEVLKKLIDDLSLDNTCIVLSGGEPLLYKDWYAFAKYVKEKKLLLAVQTNGLLLSDNAEEILEVADQLNVSIDGVMDAHNKIRGRDSFSQIIEGLEKIKELKLKRNVKNPGVGVCFTITPWNYSCLKETIDMLYNLNVGIDFMNFMHPMFINADSYEKYKMKYDSIFNIGDVLSGFLFELESFDISYLIKEIKEIKKSRFKYKGISIMFTPDLKDGDLIKYYDSNVDLINSKVDCLTPWMDAFLLSNGDLYGCCGNVLGNIKERSIKELWNNKNAEEFRRTFMEEGHLPICKNCAFKRRSNYFKINFAMSLLFNDIKKSCGMTATSNK